LEMVRRVWLYEGDTKRVIMILVAVLRLIYMLPKRQFGFGVFGGGEQDLRSQKCNQTHKKKHPPCFREVQSQSSGSSKENSPMPVSRSYINKCVKSRVSSICSPELQSSIDKCRGCHSAKNPFVPVTPFSCAFQAPSGHGMCRDSK
jgi:hypothetical protein